MHVGASCVCCAPSLQQEVEPSKGHILVLSFTPSNNKLTLIEQLEVHGSVYNLCAFQVCVGVTTEG